MSTFYLKIIATNKVFYAGKSSEIIIPAMDGQKAVLAHHENMVIAVDIGEVRFRDENEQWVGALVGNGFVQIMNNRVTMLVDTIERPEEIDIRRAEEAKERAEEKLRQKHSIHEYYHTQASLARALSRLRYTGKG